jgi:hypothetical protein
VGFSAEPGIVPPPPERTRNEKSTGPRERVSTPAAFRVRSLSRRRMPDILHPHFGPRGVPRAGKLAEIHGLDASSKGRRLKAAADAPP